MLLLILLLTTTFTAKWLKKSRITRRVLQDSRAKSDLCKFWEYWYAEGSPGWYCCDPPTPVTSKDVVETTIKRIKELHESSKEAREDLDDANYRAEQAEKRLEEEESRLDPAEEYGLRTNVEYLEQRVKGYKNAIDDMSGRVCDGCGMSVDTTPNPRFLV